MKSMIKRILNSRILKKFGVSLINYDLLKYTKHHLWLFNLGKVPRLDIAYAPPREVTQDDLLLCERLISAYHLATRDRAEISNRTSELWAKNSKKIIVAGMESLYKYSIIIIVPLALVMLSFTDLLIQVLYGKDYLAAGTSMKILAIGMIFGVLSSINANFFAGIGKPQIYAKIIYFGAFLNVILNLILIPVIGIMGAAIATAFSYFVIMAMTFKDVRKYIKLSFPIGIWARTILAGAIFTLLIWALKKILFLNVWVETAVVLVLSGIIYIAMLFLFRIIDIREVKDLYRRIVK